MRLMFGFTTLVWGLKVPPLMGHQYSSVYCSVLLKLSLYGDTFLYYKTMGREDLIYASWDAVLNSGTYTSQALLWATITSKRNRLDCLLR